MLFNYISPSCLRKGEELKAPRHASAAATRDGNLPVFPTATVIINHLKGKRQIQLLGAAFILGFYTNLICL